MKLTDTFERDYFSLLTPVVTDGAMKNRRNLLVSSFSISLIYFFDKSLSEINILGLKFKEADINSLLIASTLLVSFWFLMFVIHSFKDLQINKERKYLLIKQTDALYERLVSHTEKYQNHEDTHPNKQQISVLQREYNIYINQKSRTRNARVLSLVSTVIEYGLPVLMYFYCMFMLSMDINNIPKTT